MSYNVSLIRICVFKVTRFSTLEVGSLEYNCSMLHNREQRGENLVLLFQ